MDEILRILWTAALSFAALFVFAKLTGKKQIAQLEFIDYIMGISIGSIAAQMSVDPEIPYYHFLIAMGVYLAIDILMTVITKKSIYLRAFIKGKPLILIEDGKINYKNFKKSNLDISELLALCREKDCFELSAIAYCVFETNGKISILPTAKDSPLVSEDLKIDKPKPELSVEMVLDGKVIEHALKQENKTEQWLHKKLHIKNKKDLKEIIIASYDKAKDSFNVHYKS